MKQFSCHHCDSKIEFSAHQKIGRRDSCSKCGRDLHVCKNCNFFDPSAHRECRENIPERISDKEKSNFCDNFSPRPSNQLTAMGTAQSKESLLSQAEALFKKKPSA
jgi:hypothetical protein